MVTADRRNLTAAQTHRPEPQRPERVSLAALPTVAELLQEPSFRAGVPEVVVGGRTLDAPVRWVHTSERDDIASHLDGRELLLSMGTAWPDTDEGLTALVESLVEAGLSALVLELGTRYQAAPEALRVAAERRGLALIVLHKIVRFVALTEAGHSRIIAGQMAALRARDDVRELFTALALRGAPADHVVHELARTLGAPVILESLAHEVLVAEVPMGSDTAVLVDWERKSRAAHRGVDDDGWLVVPVDARGKRWGALVALPGPAHPAGRRNVLLQGAIALALGRLADGGTDTWSTIARRHVLEPLLAGKYASPDAAAARLEAAGVPVTGRNLYGIVLAGEAPTPPDIEAWALSLGGRGRALILDSRSHGPRTLVLLSLPLHKPLEEDALRGVLRSPREGSRVRAIVGRTGADVTGALQSLHDAIDNADASPESQIHWVERRPLARLISSLRDDHRLLDHGERMLMPLIEYDQRTSGDLLRVLGAMLAHPGNRTEAARAAHLSRSVFYQRLDLISSLLEMDLEDGETQTALHVALLARRRPRAK